MPKKIKDLQIQGTALDEDGRGIAHIDGMEVKVADLLPTERAKVTIEHQSQHRKRCWARIVERTSPPSTARQEPLCPVYSRCGGCTVQHMKMAEQVRNKQTQVVNALSAHGMDAWPVPQIIASPTEFGYRNTGKYVFGRQDGSLVMGAYRPRSHEIVDTMGCLAVEPVIDRVAQAIRAQVNASDIPIYDEKTLRTGLRYAVLRCNGAKEVLVALVCTQDTSPTLMEALARKIVADNAVCGVLRCDNDLTTGRILTDRISNLAGSSALREKLGPFTFQLGIRAFWQIHREQAQVLYRDVVALLDLSPGSNVWELYCGVGGMALLLADAGHRVTGVDTNTEGIRIAQDATAGANLAFPPHFFAADAVSLTVQDKNDAVVVDPPRKGLGPKGVDTVCRMHPQKIAYVSCSPQSLARDLAELIANGYTIQSVRLYDLMPGTTHVETLVILERRQL